MTLFSILWCAVSKLPSNNLFDLTTYISGRMHQ